MNVDFDSLLERKINESLDEKMRVFRSELQADFDAAVKQATNPAPFLSRKELATLLGVSYPTIHGWMNTGQLPFCKIGNSTKFARADVEKFVAKRKARRA